MIYKNIIEFLRKRAIELVGLVLIAAALLLAISFFSYSPNDPTFIYGEQNIVINNLLGIYGSQIADFLLQSFGVSAFLFLITVTIWGVSLIFKKKIKNILFKVFFFNSLSYVYFYFYLHSI